MHGVLIANYRIDLELSRQLSVWNHGAYQWATGKEKKKIRMCSCSTFLIFFIAILFWCQYLGALWGEISRSLWCLISLTDHRKPISDPSYRYDKNLQYNGLFPLRVTSPPEAPTSSLSFPAAFSRLGFLILSHSEPNTYPRFLQVGQTKKNREKDIRTNIIDVLFPSTRTQQQWRYLVT